MEQITCITNHLMAIFFRHFSIDHRYCERLKLLVLAVEVYKDEEGFLIHKSGKVTFMHLRIIKNIFYGI